MLKELFHFLLLSFLGTNIISEEYQKYAVLLLPISLFSFKYICFIQLFQACRENFSFGFNTTTVLAESRNWVNLALPVTT